MSNVPAVPITDSRDLNLLIGHVVVKNAQAFSLIVPPIFLAASAIRRRPFSIRRLFHTQILGTALGATTGVPMAYFRLKDESGDALADRVFRLGHNSSQIETDDYSFIGAFLGGLIGPTLFLKRAPLVSLVLGGASFGLAGGVLAHLGKGFSEGKEVKPVGMTSEVEGVLGGKK